jgi:adenylate cyclase
MERNVRLVTGLTLFAYATCHFASHAVGLFGLAIMDAYGRNILLWPFQTWPGRVALFGALFIHGGLGLRALWRRRHLRIPAGEAWQLGLGLLIPLLLIPHASNVRLGAGLFGLDDSYYRILYQYWITPPWTGFARQMVLLSAVWIHGCVGLHFWLRSKRWYPAARPALLAFAVLLPFLAVLGLVNGGWDTEMTATLHPDFAAQHGPPAADTPRAEELATLKDLWTGLQIVYVALIALILALRARRNRRARRSASVRIWYPSGRVVQVPKGFSVLEASRWARIPHASICGGRGRCSTCRIRIVEGDGALPSPLSPEAETLARVAAPPGVRLACQLRPLADLGVVPLLPAQFPAQGLHVAVESGRELRVTALFVDLRDSTRLAAGRLPFDALFLVDRYVQRVTAPIEAEGGHVTSVAGDGIMSVFGVDGDARRGAAGAIRAAAGIWAGLERLSGELRAELDGPLAFGMGLHSGLSAVGSIPVAGQMSLQFLGDTGNVAARLEAMTKELGCTVVISAEVFDAAGIAPGLPLDEVRIRGREALPVRAASLRFRSEAERLHALCDLHAPAPA